MTMTTQHQTKKDEHIMSVRHISTHHVLYTVIARSQRAL